ncbi:metalloregulator ArsR/SmtB family transcription factor [Flocculibacter collagenilyticus]|uniref:metalloregulator ArsR/SmtB family transcription factor n=1 Tax=Flocculibacter collagenilyticus TaxID=2744479 RepID=UPI0018F492F9|nr:metalloregulator ArsR/SmtB family transcription factor [Flocculibacter collagenilyticus]
MSPIQFYKCLADDTRLRCLLLIEDQQELCVCELTKALALSQPKVSRHLALLREQHVISARKEGQWMFYRIHDALPEWQKGIIKQTLSESTEYIAPALSLLNSMGSRPSRQTACC